MEEEPEEEEAEEPVLGGILGYQEDPTSMSCEYIYTDLEGTKYELNSFMACYTAMRRSISPDERFLIYVDFPNIVLFDSVAGTNTNLMSVFDDTDGVDFYWHPNSRIIAMTVVNQVNESYRDSSGTKLYLLEINEESELVRKDRHLFKLKYGCHAGGCNVDSKDLYFLDEDTLIYRTWEDDPYEAEGDDTLLRTFSIN